MNCYKSVLFSYIQVFYLVPKSLLNVHINSTNIQWTHIDISK